MKALKLHNEFYHRLIIKSNRSISFISKKEAVEENSDETDTVATFVNDDEDLQDKERNLKRQQNVSRLLPQHRNMLNNKMPYTQAESWIHDTAKYKRMMFGRYGLESGVNPAILFKSVKEIEEQREYEKIKYPKSLPEMIAIRKQMEKEKIEKILQRDEQIAKKFEKLDQWKHDLTAKVAKKEAEAQAAKDRKDRLVEEVRRHFGYKIDPRDERFKEMLEKKEKEEKKRMKEEKKKAKESKLISKITAKQDNKAADHTVDSATSNESTKS